MNHKKLTEFWKEFNGDLRDLHQFMEPGSQEDAWKMAALVALLGKDKHKIKPQRTGWDCLAQNAKCVSIATYLLSGQPYPIKHDKLKLPFTFIKNGLFEDNGYKHYLSFEGSVPLMYSKANVESVYHLPLGAAIVQEEWKKRDGEDIKFGHIRTLVDVGYNRDDGWAVFLNGTTNGPTTLVIVGDLPKDHDVPWLDYPHSLLTSAELMRVRDGDKRNRTWAGKLIYST